MISGWEMVTLAEVCNKIQDGAHKSPKELFAEPGKGRFPYLTSKNIRMGFMKLDNVQYCKEKFHAGIYHRCNPEFGDVLLTKDGASTGNVCINTLDEPFSLLSSVCLLKPERSKLMARFLIYYIQSSEGFEQITGQMTGAAIKRIILKTIKSSRISLPPLPEQKRIVAILDAAFERIDAAIANTEKNLANARELFESYLNGVFTQKGEGWEEKRLKDVVDSTCSLSYGIVQPGNDYEGGLPVVRPTDLRKKIVSHDGLKRINPKNAEKYKRTFLHGGELLLCVRGNTGVVSVAESNLVGSNVTRGIVPINFDRSMINQNFGYYIIISREFQKEIKKYTYGAALMQINIRDLKKIMISFPEIEIQNEMVKNLDTACNKIFDLESICSQKLTALTELKQSILQKAFAGELTNIPKKIGEAGA